jgi:hypothetical protein
MDVVNHIVLFSERWRGGAALLICVLCFGCHVTHSWQLEGSVKPIFTAYYRKHHTVTFSLIHTMEEK